MSLYAHKDCRLRQKDQRKEREQREEGERCRQAGAPVAPERFEYIAEKPYGWQHEFLDARCSKRADKREGSTSRADAHAFP